MPGYILSTAGAENADGITIRVDELDQLDIYLQTNDTKFEREDYPLLLNNFTQIIVKWDGLYNAEVWANGIPLTTTDILANSETDPFTSIVFGINLISVFNETRYFSVPITFIVLGTLIIGTMLVLMGVLLYSITITSKKN